MTGRRRIVGRQAIECAIARGWSREEIVRRLGCTPGQVAATWAWLEEVNGEADTAACPPVPARGVVA